MIIFATEMSGEDYKGKIKFWKTYNKVVRSALNSFRSQDIYSFKENFIKGMMSVCILFIYITNV